MTAYSLGTEISCDGHDEQTDCPDSAAVPASFRSLTAREVRADGRALGWAYRLGVPAARRPHGRRLPQLCRRPE
ncbi:hypothetical protein ACWD25_28480 [Streptomyces sp. NPDC002920]